MDLTDKAKTDSLMIRSPRRNIFILELPMRREAIRKDPQNADAYNNLAWLYYTRKENLEEAKGLVLKAMNLNPSKDDIYRDTLEKIEELRKSTR